MNLSLLRGTALLADLDEAQLGRVADIGQEQTYRSGEQALVVRTFLTMSMF